MQCHIVEHVFKINATLAEINLNYFVINITENSVVASKSNKKSIVRIVKFVIYFVYIVMKPQYFCFKEVTSNPNLFSIIYVYLLNILVVHGLIIKKNLFSL